jgi:hypothetical protein
MRDVVALASWMLIHQVVLLQFHGCLCVICCFSFMDAYASSCISSASWMLMRYMLLQFHGCLCIKLYCFSFVDTFHLVP